MNGWTNKHYGALIGVVLIVLISILGIGPTALAAIFGVIGYFVGSYLDGEFDLEDIRERAQNRGGQGR
ncbi:Small integral membrane protein (DUF2273) [Rubrobacter radiotolerans]|uniref:DUF2273 domain-containing protein n=1 Tax=Rubrobacter radiotolerans TaxID=42256 RepID=A0A023X062_RUBRA|nr:DUF2273 domain-containing protein [Rubrobacter radiotolerans]AHY45551.1 Small integral membrane protein (DUF2273) [Rubrobacter radiotolerans]MDX5892964.1 DUF2273 domain-containing protein [Rubrobacter radiotolerans]SMC02824.1 Small integral membrane protein [Rubrobacter radiotolerans DSM 5868]